MPSPLLSLLFESSRLAKASKDLGTTLKNRRRFDPVMEALKAAVPAQAPSVNTEVLKEASPVAAAVVEHILAGEAAPAPVKKCGCKKAGKVGVLLAGIAAVGGAGFVVVKKFFAKPEPSTVPPKVEDFEVKGSPSEATD